MINTVFVVLPDSFKGNEPPYVYLVFICAAWRFYTVVGEPSPAGRSVGDKTLYSNQALPLIEAISADVQMVKIKGS